MEEIKSNRNIYLWIFSGFSFLMSVFAYVIFVYQLIPGELFWSLEKSWFNVMFFYFLLALTSAFIGLIIGMKQRKISSRAIGILGIMIPIIIIIITIFSGFAVELSIFAETT